MVSSGSAGVRGSRRVRGGPGRRTGLAALAAVVPGARKGPRPGRFEPQLATPAGGPPEGDRWLHETKFDGYRIIAVQRGGSARLVTRRGQDWTDRFPGIAAAVAGLPPGDAVLDGEVVILRPDGSSDFQALQNVMNSDAAGSPVYMVFDVLYAAGVDLTRAPLLERKALLARLLGRGDGPVRQSVHIVGHGPQIYAESCRAGMEGILSKRADAPYTPGRTESWLKVKCVHRQEFVIGGYTDPMRSRVGLGALLLGYYADGALVYCGKVGTGFTGASLRSLTRRLSSLERRSPPFRNPPRAAGGAGTHWVEPQLVAEIEFTGWTADGSLRHPSFQGLREDKAAREVVREKGPARAPPRQRARNNHSKGGPMARNAKRAERITIDGQELTLTNLDKVLYPAAGFTKGEVIEYARGIAPVLLPHLKGRPLSLKRFPDGVEGEAFFQKNCPPKRPEWVPTIPLGETRSGREVDLCSVEGVAGLVWLANLAALELHAHLWTAAARNTPTMMVFDLDPGPGTDLLDCARLAQRIRSALETAGLESLAKTSGGKGIHIAVPLNKPGVTFNQTKALARAVAGMLEREEPGKVTTSMSKAVRPGRVFIDWSQNDRHKTTVSVYSLRGRERPTVSTPVAWKEVAAAVRAGDPSKLVFEAPAVLRRVERLGDLAEPLLKLRQRLPGPARAEVPGRAAATRRPKGREVERGGPRRSARAGGRRR